ncbi:MAG: hypothetical protein K8F27_15330 [Sulfuricellaceae bacterium]|nr:hypothetical protein [Sulfuricellaceae bacterium]
MQKEFSPALFLGALLMALSGPSLAARGYEGYHDVIDASPWFDGAKSTIDDQNTTVGSIGTAAWCGIDNGGTGGMKWIQGGWVKWKDSDPQIYWEYTDKDGNYDRGYDQAPGGSETYEQSKKSLNAEWKHGDTVYKTVAWSKFNTIEYKKVEYTAEMVDSPDDHTPGKAASKNNFAASMGRRAGSEFASTGLANPSQPTAQQGNVEKYGDEGSGNFRTWDSRND